MRILSHYFLTSYLKLFAVILFSSMLSIAVIEMMLDFESVLEHRNGRPRFVLVSPGECHL